MEGNYDNKEIDMILKERRPPIEITQLEAVIPRLSKVHIMKRIEKELSNSRKGYAGEQKVDRYTSLLKNDFTILQDVYLYNNGTSFQIDTLIIGPRGIFVIEIKDLSGTLLFNLITNQFIRIYHNKEESFRNPIIQATTNKLQLTEWLSNRNIKDIPIYSLVAIADPSTIIKVTPEDRDISNIVMHGEYIPHQIIQIDNRLAGRSSQSHPKIGKLILQECKAFDLDLTKEYGIIPESILGGVVCPRCNKIGMNRKHGKWNCTHCHHTSKDAHIQALSDYFSLIKPWITNKECRRFLSIESRSVATRLLITANLKYEKKLKRWLGNMRKLEKPRGPQPKSRGK